MGGGCFARVWCRLRTWCDLKWLINKWYSNQRTRRQYSGYVHCSALHTHTYTQAILPTMEIVDFKCQQIGFHEWLVSHSNQEKENAPTSLSVTPDKERQRMTVWSTTVTIHGIRHQRPDVLPLGVLYNCCKRSPAKVCVCGNSCSLHLLGRWNDISNRVDKCNVNYKPRLQSLFVLGGFDATL